MCFATLLRRDTTWHVRSVPFHLVRVRLVPAGVALGAEVLDVGSCR